MPIVFDGGVDEVEDPTLLPPNILTKGKGAEYRKGKRGIYRAKGRELRGSVSSVTWRGMYYAGYDGGPENQFLVCHAGDTLYYDAIAANMAPRTLTTYTSGTTPVIGAHYANRHYIALGTENRCFELSANNISDRQMGMDKTKVTLGLSVTQGAGSMTVVTGLTYWATEYDSTRGIESVAGSTASTSSFTSLDSVVLTISGVITNSNTDSIRIYRTVDGGAYPQGGLIAEIATPANNWTDTDTVVNTFPTPEYGFITIGGLDFERDVKPDGLRYIAGPYKNSMIGFLSSNPREIAFSADGRPESWPDAYRVPLQTHRQDIGMCMVELNNMYGVFTKDTVYRMTRLPREIDTAFAGGEAVSLVTDKRGAVSSKAATTFTLPDGGELIMFVARDGIWITNLISVMVPVTDGVDWDTRIDGTKLDQIELINNSHERRVICYYSNGVMYLDYQTGRIRITHPDHGSIRTATEAPYQGFLRVFTGDARTNNGKIYTESIKDADDSNYLSSDSAIAMSIKSAEVFPADVKEKRRLVRATWMHDAVSDPITHYFYANREATPSERTPDFSTRQATEVGLEREVNSFSVELNSAGTSSYGIHWLDIEGFESERLSGQGA